MRIAAGEYVAGGRRRMVEADSFGQREEIKTQSHLGGLDAPLPGEPLDLARGLHRVAGYGAIGQTYDRRLQPAPDAVVRLPHGAGHDDDRPKAAGPQADQAAGQQIRVQAALAAVEYQGRLTHG